MRHDELAERKQAAEATAVGQELQALGWTGSAKSTPAAYLTGEAWLHWVAAGWWIGGGLMLFVPGVYTLLLMTAMSIVLNRVPSRGRAADAVRADIEAT